MAPAQLADGCDDPALGPPPRHTVWRAHQRGAAAGTAPGVEGHGDAGSGDCGAPGFSTGTGGPFTRGIVWSLRKRWGIGAVRPARTQGVQRQWPDGSYPLAGVADRIGVHIRTVHTWIARGMLVPSQAYKGGPLKIGLTEERIEALRDYVARVRRPRRAHGIGGASDGTLRTEAGASPGRPPHQLGAARGAQDHRQRARPAAVDTTTVTDGGHRHA